MKTSTMATLIVAGAVSGFIGLCSIPSILIQRHTQEVTLQVDRTERLYARMANGRYKNFVYAEDEIYEVRDSLWNGHFRSQTVFASIPEEGGTCKVTLSGYRAGFLSMTENIIAAECT